MVSSSQTKASKRTVQANHTALAEKALGLTASPWLRNTIWHRMLLKPGLRSFM